MNALARRDISGPRNPQVGLGPNGSGRYAAPDVKTGACSAGVPHECETAVVGNVQPLVPVGDHRVCTFHALDEMERAIREGGEESERTVHVEPGAVMLREVGHRDQRVEVAGVHLSGARDHDGGRVAEGLELAFQSREVQPPDPVRRELPDSIPPQSEHRERLRVARMHVTRAEDGHPR